MVHRSREFCVLLLFAIAVGLLGRAISTAVADEADQEVIKMVIDALKSPDAEMQTGAIAIVREIAGPEVTKALAQELPNLGPTTQVQLLSVPQAFLFEAGADAGLQQDRIKRLGQIIGGAHLNTVGDSLGFIRRRQHQNGE